ncbi:MAG: hypothetical protein QY318_03170 [Candidatus Dojkabacteria bacterium]|nr:MAG: hypothetical protein QY318_03170 [Candidatus Dojkabacteria bacterium]
MDKSFDDLLKGKQSEAFSGYITTLGTTAKRKGDSDKIYRERIENTIGRRNFLDGFTTKRPLFITFGLMFTLLTAVIVISAPGVQSGDRYDGFVYCFPFRNYCTADVGFYSANGTYIKVGSFGKEGRDISDSDILEFLHGTVEEIIRVGKEDMVCSWSKERKVYDLVYEKNGNTLYFDELQSSHQLWTADGDLYQWTNIEAESSMEYLEQEYLAVEEKIQNKEFSEIEGHDCRTGVSYKNTRVEYSDDGVMHIWHPDGTYQAYDRDGVLLIESKVIE